MDAGKARPETHGESRRAHCGEGFANADVVAINVLIMEAREGAPGAIGFGDLEGEPEQRRIEGISWIGKGTVRREAGKE